MGKKVREMYGEGGSGCRRGVSLYLSFFLGSAMTKMVWTSMIDEGGA